MSERKKAKGKDQQGGRFHCGGSRYARNCLRKGKGKGNHITRMESLPKIAGNSGRQVAKKKSRL